jgi:glycosyltransferase involved in cell wall biosynthesis
MTTIAFIVNGDRRSAMGERARAFQSHLGNRYDIRVIYRSKRKVISLVRFILFLLRAKPQIAYVFDMSYSGVFAALITKWVTGCCLIIDTGDAIYELARSMGRRAAGLWLTRHLENISLSMADHIVVRGTFHQRLLSGRGIQAELIRDGVDTNQFAPLNADDLRKQYGLDKALTIGVMGSSVWNEKLRWCYGLEMVEALRLLKDLPVKGIMIGDGSGIARLKSLCEEYGIEGRIIFIGRVPYSDLPAYLNMIDICLSTQTNDVVGQVRTTGKLPLYLAAGRYVLASKVGEAVFVLSEDMMIEYEGVIDTEYSDKLARRIASLLDNPEKLARGLDNISIAKSQFDYSILAEKMAGLFDIAIQAGSRNRKQRLARKAGAS